MLYWESVVLFSACSPSCFYEILILISMETKSRSCDHMTVLSLAKIGLNGFL